MLPLMGRLSSHLSTSEVAPGTAHDAANLHRSCGLQSVLPLGLSGKLVREVTWICSCERVSARGQASGCDKETPQKEAHFPEH